MYTLSLSLCLCFSVFLKNDASDTVGQSNGMSFQLIWERPSHLESSKGRSVHPHESYISDVLTLQFRF